MKANKTLKHAIAFFSLVGILSTTTSCSDSDDIQQVFTNENAFVEPLIKLESTLSHQIMLIDEILRDSTFQQDDTTVVAGEIYARLTGNTLRISYGKIGGGTSSPDGFLRSGTMVVQMQGSYDQSGSTLSVSYENCKVEKQSLTGSYVMENTGLNTDGNLVFEIEIDSLTYADNNSLRSTGRKMTWISNFDLQTPAGSRVVHFSETGASYHSFNYIDTDSNSAVVSFVQDDVLVYEDTCQYKLTNGIILMEMASRIGGSKDFTLDMIEESDCSSLIRIYAPGKDGFFFMSKQGF